MSRLPLPRAAASPRSRLTRLVAVVAVLLPAAAAGAQGVEWTAPSLRVELDAAGSGAFLTDGNGLEVRAGVAPAFGVATSWRAAHRYAVELFGRYSNAGLDVSQNGAHWSAGNSRQVDLGAAIERRFREVFALRLGGGATWFSGPADVAPFRFEKTGTPHLSGEIGGSVRLLRRLPVYGVVTVQGIRYGGGSPANPAGGAGSVTRLLGGVRYGR